MPTIEKRETHVALFLDQNLQKAQFAVKHLAAQLSVHPLIVHVFVRNGKNEQGRVVTPQTLKRLPAVWKYLRESQQTFEAILSKGRMEVQEILQHKPVQECIDNLVTQLKAAGKNATLFIMEDGICPSPWKLEGKSVDVKG